MKLKLREDFELVKTSRRTKLRRNSGYCQSDWKNLITVGSNFSSQKNFNAFTA